MKGTFKVTQRARVVFSVQLCRDDCRKTVCFLFLLQCRGTNISSSVAGVCACVRFQTGKQGDQLLVPSALVHPNLAATVDLDSILNHVHYGQTKHESRTVPVG